jgi:GT2 family glycosyltransferase
VVGDNGCTTATLATISSYVDRLPALRVIAARDRPGANHARNRAVDEADGELVAICDADDAVDPNWLEALVRAAREAEMVGGSVDVSGLNSAVVQAWRPSPTAHGLPEGGGFLPYVVGCNCALWRDVYLAVGGCDEEIGGGGGGDDVDLSWRVQLAGGRLVYAPDAVVQYRLRPDLPTLTRQMMTYGVSMALIYRKYRDRGAPRPPLWLTVKTWLRMLQRGPGMLARTEARGRWLGETAYYLGRIRGGFRHRVVFW